MKPVLTPEQAVELDRAARAAGVPGALLMERAGRAVARACVDLCGGTYGRRVVVVCGRGNNGGDGYVAARHLARWGMRVALVAVGRSRGLAEANERRLEEVDVRRADFSEDGLRREIGRADVVVDAIFGTGFRGLAEGDPAAAIGLIRQAAAPVVAVDVPSGVDGETGAVDGEAVRATLTVTFGAAKTGAVLLPGAELAGTVRVVDIGFPPDLLRADAFLSEPADVAGWLPRRGPEGHKRDAVLLVVAGSRRMTGAPALAGAAASRIGAGLVRIAAPESAMPAIQGAIAEATFLPLPETDDGSLAAEAADDVLRNLDDCHAVAIGPGLGTNPDTMRLVREVVRSSPVALAVDADALNAFAGDVPALSGRRSSVVLTPHAGEFSRLTGVKTAEVLRDRLRHARALAATGDAVVLLKGSRTVIVDPSGRARINPTGSPSLATAGTGDVLTGMIGGLLSQGLPPAEAAAGAAYLHGLAGILGGPGLVAGDLPDLLPVAVEHVRREA